MLKRPPHTPAHLLLDDTPYFITGAIYKKRPLLRGSELKQELLKHLKQQFEKYNWLLFHWVILDNHYHLIGQSREGSVLPAIFRNIHSKTALLIREATKCEKPVWWNYWDYCPRNEKDSMTRLNYLLYNPIKHGYTSNLQHYPFSSFHTLYAKMGRERLVEQFQTYSEYKTLVLSEAYEDDF